MNKLNSNPVKYLVLVLSLFFASCTSNSQKELEQEDEVVEVEQVEATDTTSDIASSMQEDSTAWPEETQNDGGFQEEATEESNSTDENKEVEQKNTQASATKKESKTEVASTPAKTVTKTTASVEKESTPVKTVAKTTSTASTKAITSKLTKIYSLKNTLGDKLDCMRVNPLEKADRVKAGQLHDKYVGILPKMLPWVRFSGDQPQILKTEPEKLDKLNSLSDGWMSSYESIENQVNAILDKYQEKEFYSQCRGN